jgi:integrase
VTAEADLVPIPDQTLSPATDDHDLSPAARAAVAAGMPDSTRRAYQENVRRFTEWCTATGLRGLPADANDLTEYATHLAYERGQKPATIERARWAILKWHALAGLPSPATDGLVAVLKGYRAKLAEAEDARAEPRRAAPVTPERLSRIIAALDLDTAMGLRNRCMILLGFGIAARRSEIASLSLGSLMIEERGMQVTVYRQKVRRLDKPVVHRRPPGPGTALCPVRATEAWVARLAAAGRTDGPLFVRINRHDQLAPPVTRAGVEIGDPGGRITSQGVGDAIHRCALAAGVSTTGHGLRRGFATAAANARVDRRLIERQGGWTAGSPVVSGYIEDADRWLQDVLDGIL